MSYIILKHIHLSCVAITFILFSLRGYWMIAESDLLHKKWVKIAPHIIDTTLLASAISLAVLLNISPIEQHWLLAKIIGLVVYIILGTVALKRGKTKMVRVGAFGLAIVVFFYIAKVALTKSVIPF